MSKYPTPSAGAVRAAKHTAGPWCWQSFDGGKSLFLGTPNRGRLVVMDFTRSGLQGAAPRFARRTDDQGGIMFKACLEDVASYPDAVLIEAAPDLRKALEEILSAFDDGDIQASSYHVETHLVSAVERSVADIMQSARAALAKSKGGE